MVPYSDHLRNRVLQAVDDGVPRLVVVERYQVSLATIKRWLRLRRMEGHCRANFPPGGVPRIAAAEYEVLHEQLRANPDFTLKEHCEQWQKKQDSLLSAAAMSRTIRRSGWTRKKRL